jgi:hypothetical protein
MQLNGFFWLFILNLLIGATFRPLARGHDSSALIVFYVLSQVFFNFGKAPVHFRVRIPRLDELTTVCRTKYNNLYCRIWLSHRPNHRLVLMRLIARSQLRSSPRASAAHRTV